MNQKAFSKCFYNMINTILYVFVIFFFFFTNLNNYYFITFCLCFYYFSVAFLISALIPVHTF